MRILVIQKPPSRSIDGLRLDCFQPGSQYEMGTTLGTLFLSEGWGEPVITEEPALLTPVRETPPADPSVERVLRNLYRYREKTPPNLDRFVTATDLERRQRRRWTLVSP
jgi:hypothetical protein